MKSSSIANFWLLVATFIWGITFPLIHDVITHLTPELFVCLRFTMATLLLAPFMFSHLQQTTRNVLVGGLLLGICNSLAYITQTIGLQTVDPARVAFITGLNVLFVPFMLPFFRLGKPRWLDFICAMICLVGLYILTGANFHNLTIGDFWVLVCAVFFALSIVYIQLISPRISNSFLLTFYQIAFTVPLAATFSIHADYNNLLSWQVIGVVVFCAIFATIGTLFLQIRYQPKTTAAKAALIFALEPVFASIFAWLINGEVIARSTIFGGIFILLSIVLSELLGKI